MPMTSTNLISTTVRYPLRDTALHLTQDEIALVQPFVNGSYEIAFLRGLQSVSGSDLQGTARKFGAQYHHSRIVTLRTIAKQGIELVEVVGQYGSRSIWSPAALLRALTQ